PAIDILQSVSRLASRLAAPEQKAAALKLREAMAMYQRAEDLINLGAYVGGSNPKLDAAIRSRPQVLDFLKQDSAVNAKFEDTIAKMRDVAKLVG
ncbi:MAG: flagellum-specific ATP synthase FliI, partial [Bryobacteraceae bacterium]